MNKTVLFVLLLSLIAVEGICARRTGHKVSVALAFSTNQNARGSYSLSVNGAEVLLDGEKLTNTEIVRYRPYLTEVMTVLRKRPGEPTCASGKFKHVVVRDGKTTDEKGCLADDRFSSLHSAFEAMRNGRSAVGNQ